MKTILAFVPLLASVAESFVIAPQPARVATHLSERSLDKLEEVHREWKEEAARLHAVEHSVETDPDLAGVVEAKHDANLKYLEQEAHRHDSLLNEIEHAVFNDPDLATMVSDRSKKLVNQGFMDKEAHVHDSLFNEIEHALDTDGYL